MKKILLSMLIVFILSSPVMAGNQVNVVVNGNTLSTPGLIIDGKTYVPLRAVSESMGAQVDWDGSQAIVTTVKEPAITGDVQYKEMVVKALQLLKEKDPADWEMVCKYTKEIKILSTNINTQWGEAYAISRGNDTCLLSPKLFERDAIYLASTLVHESSHLCTLDHSFIVNRQESENVAYLREINVLRILGAPQQDIEDTEATRLRAIK